MQHFETWNELMAYARSGAPLYYKAPMSVHPARLEESWLRGGPPLPPSLVGKVRY